MFSSCARRALWAAALVAVGLASGEEARAAGDDADPRDPAALRAERRGDVVCAASLGDSCVRCRDPWRFEATIPIWIPGVTGTFADGSSKVTGGGDSTLPPGLVDRLPGLVENLEFALLGRFHAEHDRWSGTVDGFGVRMGTAIAFEGREGETGDSSAVILRADVGYRLLDRGGPCSYTCRSFVLDAYVGARYYAVDVDIATPLAGHLKASRDWTDPIVGLRTDWEITPRWSMLAEADVGGFDVGSKLAVWASASVRYRISHLISVEAGWTVLDCDFERRSFEWNLTLSGPRVGLTFHF